MPRIRRGHRHRQTVVQLTVQAHPKGTGVSQPELLSASQLARRALAPGLIAAIALPYLFGLTNSFVWLDQKEIVEGALIAHTPVDFVGSFLNNANTPSYFRPIYIWSHSFDWWAWGSNPTGFHTTSLVLHLLSVTLLYSLLLRFEYSRQTALAVCTLWGIHPVNSAVVGLIHAKADVIATCAMLTSLWLATRPDARAAQLLLSLGAFVVALYAKETAFVFPLLLLCFRRALLRQNSHADRYLAGVLLSSAAVAVHRYLIDISLGSSSEIPLTERLQTFATVYVDYCAKLVMPLHPCVGDTVLRFTALSIPTRVCYGIALAVIGAAQCIAFYRLRRIRPAVATFNGFLLPVSQVIPLLHFRADRFLYTPSIGFILAIVEISLFGFARIGAMRRESSGAKLWLFIACFCASCAGSFRAVSYFSDDKKLFEHELSLQPAYREGLSILARQNELAGRLRTAEALYRASVSTDEKIISFVDRDSVTLNLSSVLLRQEHWREAFDWVSSRGPGIHRMTAREDAYFNQAIAARRLGKAEYAFGIFVKYIRGHPNDASAHYLAGMCATELGKLEAARQLFSRYLEIAPQVQDRENVMRILADLDLSRK